MIISYDKIKAHYSFENIENSPCKTCIKADVCRYKEKIESKVIDVNELNDDNMLDIKISCKNKKDKEYTVRGM